MNKSRTLFLKIVNFYFISLILFTFLFLNPSFLSSQKTPALEEHENRFPSLVLIGVIVSKDTSSSIAILKNKKKGGIMMLSIGEKILDMKLIRVFENRVILQKGEKTFQIFLEKDNLVNVNKKYQENTAEINQTKRKYDLLDNDKSSNNLTRREFNRSEVERRILKEWQLIIKETRFVPNLIDEKISGFKITNLPKDSILSEVGIYKNDVIKEINGIKLNDFETFFGLYNKLKDDNQFKVTIERNGKLFHLFYILK